jgi:hypothetical protein
MVLQVDNGRAGSSGYLPLIDFRASLNKAGLLVAAASGDDDIAQALDHWRANMGAIDVSSLAVNWPDVRATLKGALTLDPGNQLSGELRGQATGRGGSEPIGLTFHQGSIALTGSASAIRSPG